MKCEGQDGEFHSHEGHIQGQNDGHHDLEGHQQGQNVRHHGNVTQKIMMVATIYM